MAKRMKYHPHGSVLFCTFSIEEGLVLLSNPLCQAIIQSCLARAQVLHPVRISHFMVEANHVHIILVVQNPDDVHGFIRCFKTESAHMINRLLGRKKRTLWCEGYDSPVVLTPLRAMVAIAYLYANPSKDNLETTVDRYPGVSSWKMFITGECAKSWKRLRRPQFTAIPANHHNLAGYSKIAHRILHESSEFQNFTLEPNAWLDAFGYRSAHEHLKINDRLKQRVRRLEDRAARRRTREGRAVIGEHRLRNQVFDTGYRSERNGRKMWCLSEKRSVRMVFIRFFRKLMKKARAVRQKWMLGDVGVPYPPGLYPPSMPKLANVIGL